MQLPTKQLKQLQGSQRGASTTKRRTPMVVRCQANGTVAPKKILMMGGTRFIGQYLARMLVEQGHEVHLFTRGKAPVTQQIPDDSAASFQNFSNKIRHIKGDRKDYNDMKAKIAREGFQVVYDINAREAEEVAPILDALPNLEQFVFCSSAGVYLKSDMMPHRETDPVDPKSRHKGKLDTEQLLMSRQDRIPWTSIRPVYIYGPLNYNPVEEFFFWRLADKRPICVPGKGDQVTQLGHVKDLADAFTKCLVNPVAYNQIYNISGERFVTFSGIAKLCAQAMRAPEPELLNYNPKEYDFGKSKAFPMRDQHFFASIDKAMIELDWQPQYSLLDGLRDSYNKDFGRGTYRKKPDYKADDMVIEKVKGKALSAA